MKTITPFAFTVLFIVMMSIAVPDSLGQKTPNKMLRHVVMFKFKDATAAADIKKVVDAFGALAGKIQLIKAFEWGTNNSPEKLNQGLTHCFLVTFSSEKDRDAYLIHPDHKAFVAILQPYIEKVTVIDYWANAE